MSTQVVVFPRGQLTAADKKALRTAGIVPVEADDPKAVVVVVPMASGPSLLSPDAMFMSLLRAVNESGYNTAAFFTKELEKRLLAAERERQKDTP